MLPALSHPSTDNPASAVLSVEPPTERRPTVPAATLSRSQSRSRSFGIVSTFPPTSCGIATFSAALAAGLIAEGASVDVVRCGPPPDVEDVLVVASIEDSDSAGMTDAIAALNADDVVIVQHEYGLYDGPDGESVVELIAAIHAPVLVVAHTVLSDPSPNQRRVLEGVCREADAVVVMTETAQTRLISNYDVDPAKVSLIPHGAATPPSTTTSDADTTTLRLGNEPARLLTWGLLGPGKGIEWAIDALAELDDLTPPPEYIVAGATHPKVRESHGEVYREGLVERAAQSVAAEQITFDDTYRDLASLTELIRSVDIVVLPYDSQDQVTSGVLVDAIAAGRPVISTAFPHAVELLSSGAGIVVPQRDPAALAAAIRSVLTDPEREASMAAEARRLAPGLSWPAVARRYGQLAGRLVASRATAVATGQLESSPFSSSMSRRAVS